MASSACDFDHQTELSCNTSIKTLHFLGLVEAANFLAAAVHEEKPASSGAGPSHGDEAPAPFAYNLGKNRYLTRLNILNLQSQSGFEIGTF